MNLSKIALLSTLIVGGMSIGGNVSATPLFTQCPATGSATGCNGLITHATSGDTIAFDASQDPYDGSDDALIGIVNTSSTSLDHIHLSGSTVSGGIFEFDDDGLQTFPPNTIGIFPTTPPPGYSINGYEGPITYFKNISSNGNSGDVYFVGELAAGQSAYFSLEGSPNDLSGGDILPPTPPSTVPEPENILGATTGLALFGLASTALKKRKLNK